MSLGMGQRNRKEVNINDMALEYMEEKYGEKFEYVCPWGNSMSGNHELMVRCDSLGEQNILVKIENFRSAQRVFKDNYLAVKYKEETINFSKGCADRVFGSSRVFYRVEELARSEELNADADFEEFFASEEGSICITIAVKNSSFISNEQIMDVIDPIKIACGAEYLGIIVIIVDDDELMLLDQDSIGDKIVSRQFMHCERWTRENGVETVEWLEEDK